LVSHPRHGRSGERPVGLLQANGLLRPLPQGLTLFQWNADNADGDDKI